MVLPVLKETLRLEFLKNIVINLVCRPTYVNLTHLVFVFTSFCSCTSFVAVILFKILVSYLLLYNICFKISYSFLLFVSFIRYVERRLLGICC